MTTTPNMSLVLPDNHGSSDTWDVILETLFGLVDQHDHTTGKGVKVPSAGLKINEDVSWSFAGTNYAITDAKAIDFTPIAAASMTGYSSALFANASDSNNLYFRNASGTNVRITNGGTLDITIVGGIGGDYASVSALLSYDDASDSYFLQQQGSPRPWARVRCGDVDIYETAASITNRVRLKSPAALAASYDVTWPAAVPSGPQAVKMSTAGALVVDGTLPHGDMVLGLAPHLGVVTGTAPAFTLVSVDFAGAGDTYYLPIPLRQGDRIKSVTFARFGNGTADFSYGVNTVTAAGANTSIGASSLNNAPAAWADTTLDVTDTTLAAGETVIFQITTIGAGIKLGNVRVTYDRPA